MHKKFLTILATVACFFSSLSAASSSKVLVVGTNAEFAPFTYIEKGQIVGFDIDIANEVCKRLGKELKLKDMPFEALIPEVVLGQVQIVAAGMSYTEERSKRVLFTKPYLTGDPLVILTMQKTLTLEELKGKNVVVNEGYTADLFLSGKEGINLIRLATAADGFLALKHKRADAFVTAKSTVDAFFAQHGSADFCLSPIANTSETCALVVSKKYPELLEEIQKALDEMNHDGTLQTLKTKWKLA